LESSKRIRFTTRAVQALPPHDPDSPSKCAEYTDPSCPGLKLQVSKVGAKSWLFRYVFRSVKRAIKLGNHPSTTVEEARERWLVNRAKLDRGIDPREELTRVKGMPTFRDFALGEYLPFAEQRKRSVEDDEAKLRLYMVPVWGDRRLCDITTRDVEMYLGELCKRHELSPATANRHLALAAKLFGLAVQWQRIDRSPTTGVAKFKEPRGKETFLTPDEVQRLMQAADTEANRYAASAVQLLLLTGCRREEILQARWEHVSFETGTLFLPKTKSGRTRHAVLNDAALGLLRELPRVKGSPWVFPGKDPQKPLNNPRKAFLCILAAAGIEQCRLHDLRHSHASLLVNQGVSLYQVQQLLGHASPQTTQRYAHLAADTLRSASQLVSRVAKKA
jgi:integrase